MVVRHGGEQMVGHMGVGNVMEKEIQKAERAVHGCQSSSEPVPLFIIVVRQLGVGVLQ